MTTGDRITEWHRPSVCPSVLLEPVSPERKLVKTSNLKWIFRFASITGQVFAQKGQRSKPAQDFPTQLYTAKLVHGFSKAYKAWLLHSLERPYIVAVIPPQIFLLDLLWSYIFTSKLLWYINPINLARNLACEPVAYMATEHFEKWGGVLHQSRRIFKHSPAASGWHGSILLIKALLDLWYKVGVTAL